MLRRWLVCFLLVRGVSRRSGVPPIPALGRSAQPLCHVRFRSGPRCSEPLGHGQFGAWPPRRSVNPALSRSDALVLGASAWRRSRSTAHGAWRSPAIGRSAFSCPGARRSLAVIFFFTCHAWLFVCLLGSVLGRLLACLPTCLTVYHD